MGQFQRNPMSAAILLLSLAVAGCAAISPEAKVRTKLVEAGLSPRMAECMAGRMVDRLSLSQLRSLQSLGSVAKENGKSMSIDKLLYKLRGLEDPEILSVTSKAALVCAL